MKIAAAAAAAAAAAVSNNHDSDREKIINKRQMLKVRIQNNCGTNTGKLQNIRIGSTLSDALIPKLHSYRDNSSSIVI